jgi:hypothetical protein
VLGACRGGGATPGHDAASTPADAADAELDAGPDAAPAAIARKVVVVQYDPTNPEDPGERLSERMGWTGDVFAYSEEIAVALGEVSRGAVAFEVVETVRIDQFPEKLDGFRYSWDSYLACRADTAQCHFPDEAAYAPLLAEDTGSDLCGRISAGEIDEIWLWGAGYFGFDEFAFRIPDDTPLAAPVPYNYWIYDGRRKDLPVCGRTFFVMGWIAERMEGHGLHSFGHRIESALIASPVGEGRWHRCGTEEHGDSDWTDFACIDLDEPGQAGCGDVHYPPNGASDYDYANPTEVTSTCDDWYAYPDPTGTTAPVSSATWGGGEESYLRWWMHHMPRPWWTTIACYDGC